MTSRNIFQRQPPAPPPASAGSLPTVLQVQVQRARAQQERGAHEDAVAVYRAVLKLHPDHVDCLHYLGAAEHHLGRVDEAVQLLRRAASLSPQDAAVHVNLGAALLSQDQPGEALAVLDRALALKEASAQAHSNRGWALHLLKRHGEAIAALERAVALNATQPRIHQRLAQARIAYGRHEDAIHSLVRVTELQPGQAAAFANLAAELQLAGRSADARAALERALEIEPESLRLRLLHAAAWLPLIQDDGADPREGREQCARELETLAAAIDTCPPAAAAEAAGDALPYYLAYQDGNQRELIARFGRMSSALMARWREAQDFPSVKDTAPAARERVRVGIVSAHVRSHSVWHALTRGWVRGLDRGRFDLHLFSLEPTSDTETAWARTQVQSFVDGPTDLAGWVQAIAAADCDVLLYPEIGMHALTARLASLRLAPLQAASWGHPQTTGLPTLDAYLSAETMEPADADDHYTEALVRLPGLGCSFEPPPLPAAAIEQPDADALPPAPYFVCPGTAFKYTPRHDRLWVRIAQAVPEATLVFFREPLSGALSDRMHERLRQAFAAAGLDAARHVRVLPWQRADRFQALLARAVAMLDTVDFSGFNTVMHAVSSGVPVVSAEGRLMRGRLGSAILMALGLPVARDDDQYVDQAIALARDPALRVHLIGQMRAGRESLFNDPAPIRALQAWIEQSLPARRAGAAASR